LEAEDREIQQAKLQELIRKGSPRDLAEANHLMKILSGYDDKYKTDYRAKVAEEVEQLRRKADLLREMLLGVAEGETIGQSDVFEVTPPPNPLYFLFFVLFLGLTLGGRTWRSRFGALNRNYRNWWKTKPTTQKPSRNSSN
jgi:hypothetical protein